MAFDPFTHERIVRDVAAYVERIRRPAAIRAELDIGYRINNHSIEFFEIRPGFFQPDTTQHIPIAKATYVRTRDVWKRYWLKCDLKWHGYEPLPESPDLARVRKEFDDDPWCCFWGLTPTSITASIHDLGGVNHGR